MALLLARHLARSLWSAPRQPSRWSPAARMASDSPATAEAPPVVYQHLRTQVDCTERTRIEDGHPRTLYTLFHSDTLSAGTEDVDAGSEVPWHEHATSEEVIFCTAGEGTAYVGTEMRRMVPGVMVHIPRQTRHRFVNASDSQPLSFTWTLSPPLRVAQFRAP